ncbi:MAG: helix-turn-helix transcriptional regulator [Deltaproteobacteria bacterium]|jgi:transcriptional regulator with XRE-family HTH domain
MFGKFIKERRIKKGLTLREFCKLIEVDASNWSKIERGLLAPPRSEYKLRQIAEILEITPGSDSWFEMKDRAELDIGSIPQDIRSDKELIGYLPMFFRTIRSEKPAPEELDKLIDIIRKGGQ